MTAEEVERRLVHAGGAVFPVAHVLGFLTWPQLQLLYIVGAAVTIALEFLRLVVGIDAVLYRRLIREYERSNLAGYALYVFGSTAAVLVFEPRIAVPALLILALVDPVSGLLARNEFGQPKRPAVIAVTFALSGIIAVLFVPLVPALLAAALTSVADGMSPVIAGYVIDDNLTIPIGTGVVMWLGLAVPV